MYDMIFCVLLIQVVLYVLFVWPCVVAQALNTHRRPEVV